MGFRQPSPAIEGWAIAWIALGSLLPISPARADASSRLVYVRGPGAEACPSESAVRAAVSARLGYDPFFPIAKEALFVEVTRAADVFRVNLKLVDADNRQRGVRSLTAKGKECSDILDATALTISLIIDPDSIARAPRPKAPVAPDPPPPPAPSMPPPEPPPPAPLQTESTPLVARQPAVQGYAGLGIAGDIDAAPSPSMGARLFVGLESRALSFDLEGRVDLPAAGPAQARGVRVRSWLYAGAIVPCLRLGFLYGCGVASIGSLTAMSVGGVTASRTNGGLWAAVGGRLGAQIPVVDPLVVRAWVEVLGMLNRDMLTVDRNPVYTFPPASGTAAIAVAWRFL